MSRRFGVLAAVLALTALLVVPSATGARKMMVGLLDETSALYGNPDKTFPMLQRLRVQVVRMDLYWGGNRGNPKRIGVAKRRPAESRNPSDPSMRRRPSSRAISGSQPRICFARVMSGCRCCGSSTGSAS